MSAQAVRQVDRFATATDVLAALEARQISAVELLSLHRQWIERDNPALNVIVELDLERAERAALEADARRARGDSGALLGLPITIKESINVAGLRTTVGVPEWSTFRSEHDAPLTARARAAGAVLLGKTNVPPLLTDWQANNPLYGRTDNPWDRQRTPGGSTAGAAAVAAGLTPLEFGSDIAGSIRVPAAFCGVYGHRPSETALPRYGEFPFPPLPNPTTLMGVQGPLARSAEDLERALDVVAGAGLGEDVAWHLTLPAARHRRLAEFRVAVLPRVDWVPLDDEVATAQDELVARLRAVGCRVEHTQPERLGNHRDALGLYLTLLATLSSTRDSPRERQRKLEKLRSRDDPWSAARVRALAGAPSDYLVWSRERELLRASFRAFFRDWDVLLSPSFFRPAFPHIERSWPVAEEPTPIELNGVKVPEVVGMFYPSIATLPGQPATAFPVGLTRSGLPLGLQAIGPYLEDRTPMRFAALVAREWGGFIPPPAYA